MSTSGSANFNQTCLEIITEAYALIRVAVEEEALTNAQAQEGMRALNTLVKAWNADGLHQWTKEEGVLVLVEDQQRYDISSSSSDHHSLASDFVQTTLGADEAASQTALTVSSITGISASDYLGIELDDGTMQWTTVNGAPSGTTVTATTALTGAASEGNAVYAYTTKLNRPTRILHARHRTFHATAPTDVEVTIEERPEYYRMPNKTSSGKPNLLYYDPQRDAGYVNIWPTSSNSIDTVRFTFERPLEDFDALTNNADFPQEWLMPLAFNLAYVLAFRHSFPLAERQLIGIEAKMLKEKLLGFDREYGSVYFQPDTARGGGYR